MQYCFGTLLLLMLKAIQLKVKRQAEKNILKTLAVQFTVFFLFHLLNPTSNTSDTSNTVGVYFLIFPVSAQRDAKQRHHKHIIIDQ